MSELRVVGQQRARSFAFGAAAFLKYERFLTKADLSPQAPQDMSTPRSGYILYSYCMYSTYCNTRAVQLYVVQFVWWWEVGYHTSCQWRQPSASR